MADTLAVLAKAIGSVQRANPNAFPQWSRALFDLFLRPTRFAFAFLFFIKVFAVIHQTANGGIGIRRNFDQIQFFVAGNCQRVTKRQDP